jgi:hypothetical protein
MLSSAGHENSPLGVRCDVSTRLTGKGERCARVPELLRRKACAAAALAEAARLIHVEPYAIKLYSEGGPVPQGIRPPARRARRKPVREYGVTRPDMPDVLGPVRVRDERACRDAGGVWLVRVRAVRNRARDGGVDDRDVYLGHEKEMYTELSVDTYNAGDGRAGTG